jgi:hypothetical protein
MDAMNGVNALLRRYFWTRRSVLIIEYAHEGGLHKVYTPRPLLRYRASGIMCYADFYVQERRLLPAMRAAAETTELNGSRPVNADMSPCEDEI